MASRTYPARTVLWWLGGALLLGLLVRAPGVWWGSNFPPGWFGHHPDEYTHVLHTQRLINPYQPDFAGEDSAAIGITDPWSAGFSVTPYPKGLAAHIAAPFLARRILTGTRTDPPPPSAVIIPIGRVISVIYGTATIAVVFLLGRRLFQDDRVALVAAWLMAVGGLHVTQSHFFVSDVPALFWALLGTLLLLYDLDDPDFGRPPALAGAAVCAGIAFGLKIWIAALPPLGLVALARRRRLWRVAIVCAFGAFGVVGVNLGFLTPRDLLDVASRGVADPFEFPIGTSALLYLIELPALVSLPALLLAIVGLVMLARPGGPSLAVPRGRVWLVVALPIGIQLALVLFRLDPFPRHLIPLIPWFMIAAAIALVRLADRLPSHAGHAAVAVIVIYLAVFVYDGEKGFIDDPRNEAAAWLASNVPVGRTMWWYFHDLPGHPRVAFPEGRPDVVIEEMHHANHYLSGVGFRDSLPRDYRSVFASRSQAHVDAFQALLTGKSEYEEVARFGEGYFMPEYVFVDRLLGNRSRNYLAEVRIFLKRDRLDRPGPDGGP